MTRDTQFQEATFEDWVKAAESQLKGKPFDKLFSKTYEGITVKPLYDQEDVKESFTYPGDSPFVRGTTQSNDGWSVCQYLHHTDPEIMNKKLVESFKRGQNTIYISVDHIENTDQLKTIFHNIDVEEVTFYIDATKNRAFLPLFVHYCETSGISLSKIKGTIAIDPFFELVQLGVSERTFQDAVEYIASSLTWTLENNMNIKLALLRGREFHESGANLIQELSFTFLKSIELLETLTDKGFSINDIARSMQFSFTVSSDFFMEIAKLRAAKQIWATIVSAYGGDEHAQKICLHAETSFWNKSKLDMHVNLLRTTSEAFSAVIGGVNYVTISPFDELTGQPSELADRIARNIHYILREESFLHKVQDPAGGSYYVDTLTKEICENVWNNIQTYEKSGGFLKRFIDGTIQNEIENTYEWKRSDVEKRNKLLIGTNIYANLGEKITHSVPNEDSNTFIEIANFQSCLQIVKEQNGSVASLKEHKTTKESHIRPLTPRRLSEPFERLREKADMYKNKTGAYPSVTVTTVGQLKDYKPRLDFIRGVLATGGIEVKVQSVEDQEIKHHQIVILCGTNEDYARIEQADISWLIEKSANLWMVGKEGNEWMGKWHIHKAIDSKLNVLHLLEHAHQLLGVDEE
ncbi:methylmalonyl-CoA mutase family protein [Bacillus sp. FJAT-47783]|uniref:methylmalonyl-CoA mutase family protein n=1 Tax=Bacillus sp. FJAT-47783 TaxID=2922712 RepID=UPI001FAC8E1F|nr:methylmalonyl-CoA mutase family protein [Bacillus sp. FJAT-47783]